MKRAALLAVILALPVVSRLAAEPKSAPSVVFFGDSITAGYGLSASEAYPALIEKKVAARGWKARIMNAGLSGDTTAGGVRRLDWVLRQRVDLLVLALGANDGLRGVDPAVTRTNLETMIDRARAHSPSIRIVLAGMRMPPNLGPDYTARFRAVFPAVAKAKNAALIPFLLDGVAANPDLNQGDRIHPTAAGQKVVADNVWRVIAPLVGSLQ